MNDLIYLSYYVIREYFILFFLEYFDLFFVIAVRKQFGVFQKEQNRLSAHNLFSSKQKPLSKNKKPMKN